MKNKTAEKLRGNVFTLSPSQLGHVQKFSSFRGKEKNSLKSHFNKYAGAPAIVFTQSNYHKNTNKKTSPFGMLSCNNSMLPQIVSNQRSAIPKCQASETWHTARYHQKLACHSSSGRLSLCLPDTSLQEICHMP